MTKLVSDDSLSRALGGMDEDRADAWIASQLDHVCAPLLATPWILDIDTTIKALYGKQEGATVGYNPLKPGRPPARLSQLPNEREAAWCLMQKLCKNYKNYGVRPSHHD